MTEAWAPDDDARLARRAGPGQGAREDQSAPRRRARCAPTATTSCTPSTTRSRSTTRSPPAAATPSTLTMEGEGAGELALDESNLVIRAARALAAHGQGARARPPAPAQADPARRRAGRRHRRRRRHAGRLRRAVGHRLSAATTWPTIAADARLRRAVPAVRRHRARHRPRRGGQPGAGPRRPRGTGWSRSPTAACPRRRSTASSTGCAPPAPRPPPLGSTDDLLAALRQRDPAVLGAALGNDLQAAALSLRPALADVLEAGRDGRRARRPRLRLRPDLRLPRRRRRARRRGSPTDARAAAACAAQRRTAHRPGAGRPGRLSIVANIVNLDRVQQGVRRRPARCSTDVSLGLDDADRIGVVGLNGAGKSTLLRMLDQGRGARRGPGHPPPRPAGRRAAADARPRRRRRPSATSCSAPPGCRGLRRRARVGRRRRRPRRSSTASACRASAWTSRSARCPVASGAGSRWPRCWSARPTC